MLCLRNKLFSQHVSLERHQSCKQFTVCLDFPEEHTVYPSIWCIQRKDIRYISRILGGSNSIIRGFSLFFFGVYMMYTMPTAVLTNFCRKSCDFILHSYLSRGRYRKRVHRRSRNTHNIILWYTQLNYPEYISRYYRCNWRARDARGTFRCYRGTVECNTGIVGVSLGASGGSQGAVQLTVLSSLSVATKAKDGGHLGCRVTPSGSHARLVELLHPSLP